MGPDEDRHRHYKKQGSAGDRVLLLLQIMMIGIFLVIIQIAHMTKNRRYQEWRLRQMNKIRQELLYRKQNSNLSHDALEMLRLTMIINEESQEEEEDALTLSHRRVSSPITACKRSRSPSPSICSINNNIDDSLTEHILESKSCLQISQ